MADPDYFTLAELTALPNMGEAQYTEARKLEAAAHITAIIERACETSFVARTVTAEIHDGGVDAIVLRQPYVRSVTSATENGSAVTDTLRVSSAGVLTRYSSATSYVPVMWVSGVGNVSVTYQSGYSAAPPSDIKEAALLATRDHLLGTSSSAEIARRQSKVNETPLPPSVDRPTGFPEADAVILGWRDRIVAMGFY